jgi:hypothetical protein
LRNARKTVGINEALLKQELYETHGIDVTKQDQPSEQLLANHTQQPLIITQAQNNYFYN